MVRVRFIATGQRHAEEIVNAEVVIRDYLESKNAVMGAVFNVNGSQVPGLLGMTFGELARRGVVAEGTTINIYETIKTISNL